MNSATPFESNPNGVWAAQPEWFLVGTDNSRPLVASCMPIWNDRYSISAHGAAHLIEMPMHEMTDSAIALEHICNTYFEPHRDLREVALPNPGTSARGPTPYPRTSEAIVAPAAFEVTKFRNPVFHEFAARVPGVVKSSALN